MTNIERLKLELVIREHIDQHGEVFYEELASILQRIQNETSDIDLRGKPSLRVFNGML